MNQLLKLSCLLRPKTLRENISIISCFKHTIDYSRVPVLALQDLEEEHVRGNGPGGQAVNKTSNAVILKHTPTGIVVKCHQTRSLARNRDIAKEILIKKLDNLLNGDMSVEAQENRILEKKSKEKSRKSEKLKLLKDQWKEREGIIK